MPLKACLTCGKLSGQSRCLGCAAEHERKRKSTKDAAFARRGITRPQWRKLRAEILKRDGYRCMAVVDGVRCPETEWLEVHHANGDGADNRPDNLFTVCRAHHGRLTHLLNRSAA